MHGPVGGVEELPRLFRLKERGGLLNRHGVIDYARPLKTEDGKVDLMRSVTPGVFLIVYTDHPQIQADLGYFDVTGGDGYYNLYTPYHLVTNEIPLSIASAVFFNQPTVVAKRGLVTEVTAVAKRNLKAGEKLTGAGSDEVYSSNDLYQTTREKRQVPLNLLPGARMRRDVAKDSVLTYDDVELLTDTTLYHLRKLQDDMF
jgi:predicted homoserine dehydrogenase-like protein